MIITIDGPAAAGKGTLAARLAEKYGLAYFDTGMTYRAVGLAMTLDGRDVNDAAVAEDYARRLTFPQMLELSKNPDFRSSKNGVAASVVSAYPGVRQALLQMQRDFAHNPVFADGKPANGAVYDGRDTGTVVCPQADFKFFITASPEIRAERRFKELQAKGMETPYAEVLSDITARDERDSKRAAAPLRPAADAEILDTSALSIEEVLRRAAEIIDSGNKRLEK